MSQLQETCLWRIKKKGILPLRVIPHRPTMATYFRAVILTMRQIIECYKSLPSRCYIDSLSKIFTLFVGHVCIALPWYTMRCLETCAFSFIDVDSIDKQPSRRI